MSCQHYFYVIYTVNVNITSVCVIVCSISCQHYFYLIYTVNVNIISVCVIVCRMPLFRAIMSQPPSEKNFAISECIGKIHMKRDKETNSEAQAVGDFVYISNYACSPLQPLFF